jgi:hypothetical protein
MLSRFPVHSHGVWRALCRRVNGELFADQKITSLIAIWIMG